jgi:chromosome partitioning protein
MQTVTDGSPQRVVVINSKGGSGKTTLATNLAAALTAQGLPTALMDYDKQASSSQWLRKRSSQYAPVAGVEAFRPTPPNMTRSWFLRVPATTRWVVVDTPSALDDHQLRQFVTRADVVLIPVMPSPTDIHAVTRFIERLLVAGRARSTQARIGIVANRVKLNLDVYRHLRKFLDTLKLPVITQLHDSHCYLQAAMEGLGVGELNDPRGGCDTDEWGALYRWISDTPANRALDTTTTAMALPPQPHEPMAA